MSKKSKIWIASILAVIFVAASIGAITMYLVNKWEVVITVKGDSTSTVEYGEQWKDPGATAYGTSTLFTVTHDDLKLHTTGKVDTSKVGTYEITYAAKYRGVEGKKTRKVTVRDSQPPAITVDGGEQITLPYGLPWQDSYSATDNADGDLTAKVQVDGQVNVNAAGSHAALPSLGLQRKPGHSDSPGHRDAARGPQRRASGRLGQSYLSDLR